MHLDFKVGQEYQSGPFKVKIIAIASDGSLIGEYRRGSLDTVVVAVWPSNGGKGKIPGTESTLDPLKPIVTEWTDKDETWIINKVSTDYYTLTTPCGKIATGLEIKEFNSLHNFLGKFLNEVDGPLAPTKPLAPNMPSWPPGVRTRSGDNHTDLTLTTYENISKLPIKE